jgi:hypothetical protein
MRNLKQRVEKIVKELSIQRPDESAWWEAFKTNQPELSQNCEDFFEKHKNDPDFLKEVTEGKFSDNTINEFADFCLERSQMELLRKTQKTPINQESE